MEPCTLVIFGAGGNLVRVKLIPSLFDLETANRLPQQMMILAVSRAVRSREQWIELVVAMLKEKYPQGYDQEAFERFSKRLQYHSIHRMTKIPIVACTRRWKVIRRFLETWCSIWRCHLPSFPCLSTIWAIRNCSRKGPAGVVW